MNSCPDYKPFKAIFKPHRTDDLKSGMERFIGKELTFQYAWTMDEDDSFPGEIAYRCNEPGFYYWVPERDLIRTKEKKNGANRIQGI